MPARIALLGAESTGKTSLSHALSDHLRAGGHRVAVVPEVLRQWCLQAGRLPRPEEHLQIAQDQERRVDEAARDADIVIADTTALMVAIYGARLHAGDGVYTFALERQRTYDLHLLTGLDLPWVDDGLHRSGPHDREPVDALVREALARAGVGWRVVYGMGEERVLQALQAVGAVLPWAWQPTTNALQTQKWARLRAQCEKCGDADCEHRLFTRLTEPTTEPPTAPTN